jgi:hypothetical protein
VPLMLFFSLSPPAFFFGAHTHTEVDVVALIQCTSPFVRVAHLNEAIAKMTAGCCDSVFSVTRSHSLRWMQLAEPKIESSSSGRGSESLVDFLDFFFQQLCPIAAAVSPMS